MTVSSTTNKVSYSGNGSTTVFAYTFKIFADADLKVFIRSSAGVETLKTLTTHYTVSNAGNASGGNVTFTTGNTPASGETVVIQRELALTQGTDYVENDPFPAESHEDALDRLTFITQQQQEEIDRAIKASVTNTISSTEFAVSASDRANKILSFDGSGDLTVTEGKVDTVTTSVSAVSAGGTPTASATYTASSGALALAFGLVTGNTGASGSTGSQGVAGSDGSNAGLAMTFSNSTSDADPGSGKLAFNNATVSSVSILFIDDADDNSVDISGFVQSFDDVVNSTARGIILITKEGTPSTFALFKVSGAVTDASGYTKVPVTHVVSNGTFSNSDGITVSFSYSGADGNAAGSSSLVTTGALDSGSITSGFGSINNGASAITTTGVITGGTVEATGDTSAGDNAALGFTAAEGAIITGQGSTNDVTIKNDADAAVIKVPTGTTNVEVVGNLTVGGTLSGVTTGKVLQVVQAIEQRDSNASSSGTSYSNVTGLECAITPSATSSKILVEASFYVHTQSQNYSDITLFRDSTNLATNTSSRFLNQRGDGDSDNSNNGFGFFGMVTLQILDSPSSTSELDYTLQSKRGDPQNGSIIFLGGAVNTIICTEIAG